MAEFSDRLLQMLAMSRAQQAPAGRGPIAVGGGGGGGMQGQRTSVNVANDNAIRADVDLGSALKWLGVEPKTPTLYREIGEKAHQMYLGMTPEQRQQYMSDPKTQELMGKMQKAGYPGIIQGEGGLTFTGSLMDTVPAEDRGRRAVFGEPKEPQIAAEMWGEKARASYDVYRPKHEAEIIGQEALRRLTESETTLRKAKAAGEEKTTELAPKLADSRVNYERAQAALHNAQAATEPAKKQLYTNEADYYTRMPAEKTIGKESPTDRALREQVESVEKGWNNSQKAHEAAMSDTIKSSSIQSRRNLVGTLGSATVGHIQQMMALTGDPIKASGPASYYLSQVASEMAAEPVKQRNFPLVGDETIHPEEDRHNRRILNTTEMILSSFGAKTPAYIQQQALRNVETLAQRVNPSPESAKQMLVMLGYFDSVGLRAPNTARFVSKLIPSLDVRPEKKEALRGLLQRQGGLQ